MFDTLFLSVLNMSITASLVIPVVLLVRLLLKKAPKFFSYALWAIVLFRLICPFAIQTNFSFIGISNPPTTVTGLIEYIPQDIVHIENPRVKIPLPIVNNIINENLPQGEEQLVANPLEAPISLATSSWLMGVAIMLIFAIIQFIKLKRKLVGATPLRDNLYIADHINSPFVMGFIKPHIYLPSSMAETEQAFIIAHEQCHIKRFDHITRILGFIALAIHWFNPLAWLAFILSGKDMEMSCDEAVMKKMDTDIRAEYSQSLLRFTTGKKFIAATPLAFGESDIKDRVKNVMRYKKPTFCVIVLALIAVVVLCIAFATNHSSDKSSMQWAKNLQVQDIDKIELVVQPSAENERYRLFKNDEFANIVELVNESKGTYLDNPELLRGSSIIFYVTTKDGIRHTFSNGGNTYLMIDGVTYSAEYDWLSSWDNANGNTFLPSDFDFRNEG